MSIKLALKKDFAALLMWPSLHKRLALVAFCWVVDELILLWGAMGG